MEATGREERGRDIAGKQPVTLIMDGAQNFHEAYEKGFFTGNPMNHTSTFKKFEWLVRFTITKWKERTARFAIGNGS
jgi:hypothetical protein